MLFGDGFIELLLGEATGGGVGGATPQLGRGPPPPRATQFTDGQRPRWGRVCTKAGFFLGGGGRLRERLDVLLSAAGGAHRPLPALCPPSPCLACPHLPTPHSFPLGGCANGAPRPSLLHCSVSGPRAGRALPLPLAGCVDVIGD